MGEFFNGLLDRVKTEPQILLYDAIIFAAVVLLVLLIVRTWLILRRWYLKSKLRRQSPDFQTAVNHITETKKPLNPIQRFFLGQTGAVFGKLDVIISSAGAVVIFVVAFIVSRFSDNIFWVYAFRVFIVVEGLIAIIQFFRSVIKLVRYGRLLSLLYWIVLMAVYVYDFYIIFVEIPL